MAPPDLSRVDIPSVERPQIDWGGVTEFVVDSLHEAEVSAEALFHEKSIPIPWSPDPKLDEGSRFMGSARVQAGKFSVDNPIWIKGLSIWGWLEPFSRIKTVGRPTLISDFCGSYYDLGDELSGSPVGSLYPGGILKPVGLRDVWDLLKQLKAAGGGSSEVVQALTTALHQLHLTAHFFSRPEQVDVCYPSLFSMGVEAYLNFPATLEMLQDGAWQSFGAAIGAGTSMQAENVDLTPLGDFLSKGYQWQKFRIASVHVHFDPVQDPYPCAGLPQAFCNLLDRFNQFAPTKQVQVDLTGIQFDGLVPTSHGLVAFNISGNVHLVLDTHGRGRMDLRNIQVTIPTGDSQITFRADGSLEGSLTTDGAFQLDTAKVVLADLSLGPLQFSLGSGLAVTESLQFQGTHLSIDYDRHRPLENILLEWVGDLENILFLPNKFLVKLNGTTEGNLRLVERDGGLFYRPETFNTSLLVQGALQDNDGLAWSTFDDALLVIHGLPPDEMTEAAGSDERNLQISASIGSIGTPVGNFSFKLGSILQVLYVGGLGKIGILPDQFKWLGEWGVSNQDLPLDLKDQFLISNDGEETLWNIGFTQTQFGQPQRIGPLSVYGGASLSGSFAGIPIVDQVVKNWKVTTSHPLDIVFQQTPIAQGVDLSGGDNLLTGFDVVARVGSLFDLASGKVEFKQSHDKAREFIQTSWDLGLTPIHSRSISLRRGRVTGALELPFNLSDYVKLVQRRRDWATPFWSNISASWGGVGRGETLLKPRGNLSWSVSKRELAFHLNPRASWLRTGFEVAGKKFTGRAALTGAATLFEKEDEQRLKFHEFGLAAGEVFYEEGKEKIPLGRNLVAFLENPAGWPGAGWRVNKLPTPERYVLDLSPGRGKVDGDFNVAALSKLLMSERPLNLEGADFIPFGKVSKKIALSESGLIQLLREVLARQRWEDRRQERVLQKQQRKRSP